MQQASLQEYKYVYVPSNTNADITLLLLHGTGGDEHSLIEIGSRLCSNVHLLSPRGNVVEDHSNRFFERFSEGVFNEEDLKKRSKDLSDFVEAAKEEHSLQNTNVVAVGYSNGANIAASLLLLYPHILDGAILLRAMLPLKPPEIPNLSNKPILLLNGTQDRMIDESQAKELAELFQTAGAKVSHQWQNTGHSLTQHDIEISAKWLADNFKNV